MENKTNKITFFWQTLVLVLLVLIDQITKIVVRNTLAVSNKSVSVIKGVFSFTYVENRGSVWGILQGKIDFLLIISLFLYLILIYVYVKLPKTSNYEPLMWIVSIMVAGALGNTIDRMFFGYVTDFLYFELIDFPVFNFADCCITCTAVATIVLIMTKYKDDDFKFLLPIKRTNGESNTDN